MTFACDIPLLQNKVFNSKQFKELNEEAQQEIAGRVERFVRNLNTFAPVATDPAQQRIRQGVLDEFMERFAFTMDTARQVSINPNSGKNLQYFLSYDFALDRTLMGMGDKFTEAGGVRQLVNRAKKMGAGESHVVLANIEFLERSRQADIKIDKLRRQYGVDKDLMDRIKLDLYEVGFAPIAEQAMQADTPPAVMFQRMRQERVMRLMESVGIDHAGQNRLADIVSEVVDSYNEVYEITKAFGVVMGDSTDYLNYFPRDFSPEAKRRIAWKRDSQVDYTMFNFDGTSASESIYSAFSKSRVTNHYIPEDSALVDFLLTNVDPDIYDKLGVESVLDVIQDDGTFTGAFVKYIDEAQPGLFDGMVESGLVAKLPMTTGEVYNYMVTRYDLPFKSLREFTAVDFENAGRLYRNQLEQLAGRSIATQYVATAALEGGWGITKAEKAADDAYRNYVPLVGREPTAVIPNSIATRFGLDTEMYQDTFVHPTVANMYRAAIQLNTDPAKMGILARMYQDFNSSFVGQALATSGFIFRQIYGVAVGVHAAGGNVVNYARNATRMTVQLASLWAKGKTLDGFANMFDDKVRRYATVRGDELLTERELWNYLRTEGFVQDLMPWLGEPIHATGYRPRADLVEATKRQARYMASIFANGDLSAPQKFANLYGQLSTAGSNMTEKVFYSFQMTNVLLDQVARFSVVQSLTTNDPLERGVRALQGNASFQRYTVEEATAKAANYFFDYGDLGRTGDKMRTVIPFYSFMAQNTFGIMRMMVRDPTRFVAYNRLYAALNDPARDEGADLPEAGTPGWMQRTNPLYWVDKATGQVIAFPTSTWDPVQSGQQMIFDAADDLSGLFGIKPPRTTDEELGTLPWETSTTNRTLTNMIESMYPPMQIAYGLLTGEDTQGYALTGPDARDTTFLGVPMSAMNRFLLSKVSPTLTNINRSNPGFMFGRPARFDGEGRMIEEPIPAWLTGASRDPRDRVADFRSQEQRIMAALGVSTYVVDVAYNMGKNEQQVYYEIGNGRRAISRKMRAIKQMTDPQQIQRELEELEIMRFTQAQMVLDWENFRAWREERGLSLPAANARMRRQELGREQVRVLTEQQEYDLLMEIYGEIPEDE